MDVLDISMAFIGRSGDGMFSWAEEQESWEEFLSISWDMGECLLSEEKKERKNRD